MATSIDALVARIESTLKRQEAAVANTREQLAAALAMKNAQNAQKSK